MKKNKEMITRICILLGLCSLILGVNSALHNRNYNEDKLINAKKIKINKSINQVNFEKFMKITNDSKIKLAKDKQIKEQKMLLENNKLKEQKVTASRGGYNGFTILQEVECHISWYSNSNTRQEGGKYDKKGNLLENHEEQICALPSSVPYGYYLILEERVNGSKIFKNVDTGGAIHWLNDEHTKMKVDIFIPDVTEKWLYNNTKKRVIKGWICKDLK